MDEERPLSSSGTSAEQSSLREAVLWGDPVSFLPFDYNKPKQPSEVVEGKKSRSWEQGMELDVPALCCGRQKRMKPVVWKP